MNILPFKNIEIYSPLTQSEIEGVIKNNVAWTTDLGMSFTKNSHREYEGFIENGTFKIRRILKRGRNAFIPIVIGTILKSSGSGSRIRLEVRLPKVITVVMFLFLLAVIIQFSIAPNWSSLVLSGSFSLFFMFVFNHEANSVMNKLRSILKV